MAKLITDDFFTARVRPDQIIDHDVFICSGIQHNAISAVGDDIARSGASDPVEPGVVCDHHTCDRYSLLFPLPLWVGEDVVASRIQSDKVAFNPTSAVEEVVKA